MNKIIPGKVTLCLLLWMTVLTFLVAISGCSNSKKDAAKTNGGKSAFVKVIKVKKASITPTIELTGSIEPVRIARLASPAEGPVQRLMAREGDYVKEGQLLVTIGRNKAAEASVQAFKEEVKKEEEELRRIERLVKIGAISEDQLDKSKASYERARSQLINVTQSAQDYEIRAPWNGLVSSVAVTEGHYVNPRSILLEMYDPKSLVVRLSLSEVYALNAHKGKEFTLSLDAYPGQKFHARINRVYPQLDPITRTRTVEAIIIDSVEVVPGMFVRALLPLKTIDNAVVAPDRAVLTKTDGSKIVFIVKDGKAISRTITTGVEQESMVQIIKGVNEGDSIVVDGNEHLKNDSVVKIVKSQDPADPNNKYERGKK